MPPDVIVTPGQSPIIGPQADFSPWVQSAAEWFLSVGPAIVEIFKDVVGFLVGLSFPLSLIFFIVIIYSVERLKGIRKKEEQVFDLKIEPAYEMVEVTEEGGRVKHDETLAKRWQTVSTHINSTNPNDWKQAIMEADIILEDVLTKLGYQGDGVGEKLKRAEPADFGTLNEAWEAHKVRNQIAHEGSSFMLNEVEAKRTIQLYRKVFEEFYYL